MDYPLQLIAPREDITIYIPNPAQIQEHYQKLRSNNKDCPFPFWAKIWPSSIALSDFLTTKPHWIEGKQVLELGAGIGLPSFAIAKQAAHVTISDFIPEAIKLIQKNIHQLSLQNAKAVCIDWNEFPESIHADVILLSDINYAPDQFESLLTLINQFLLNGSTIIIATPQRIMGNTFINVLQPYIKEQSESIIKSQEGSTTISIFVLFE